MNSMVICMNVIRRMVKEINVFLFLIILPVLGGVLAIAMAGRPAVVDIGIANVSSSSRPLVQALTDSGKYKVHLVRPQDMESMVQDKEISVGILLPENFDSAADGESIEKVKLVSRKNNNILTELNVFVNKYMKSVREGSLEAADKVSSGRAEDMEVPRMAMGMLTMFMLMFTGAGMGLILEDKKSKTFMRVFCTPLREHEMVLGNLMANMLLGIFQILLFLLSTKYILGIDWGTSMWNVFLILCTFLLTAIGLGIGLMGFIRSNEVFSIANTIIATMTCMLGGSFFPTSMMSGALKKLSNFLPQKWAMEAFEKVYGGGSTADIGLNLLILLLFGAVFFTFGVKVLKPAAEDL